MSRPETSSAGGGVISSAGSVAGTLPSSLLAGLTTGQSGQHPVPASHSPERGSDPGSRMSGTSGPRFYDSLPSANLQQCLESRLRVNLDVNGSPEYVLTWSHWDIGSGPPICRLRALARPTGDNVYSGWGTPSARDAKDAGPALEADNDLVSASSRLPRQVLGATSTSYPAGTESRGVLNPAFSRWLMGFPRDWDVFAGSVMRSSRRSRRSSSTRSSKLRK
jgi:hypothetical protein